MLRETAAVSACRVSAGNRNSQASSVFNATLRMMAAGDRCLIASVNLLTIAPLRCVRKSWSISSIAAELVGAKMSCVAAIRACARLLHTRILHELWFRFDYVVSTS